MPACRKRDRRGQPGRAAADHDRACVCPHQSSAIRQADEHGRARCAITPAASESAMSDTVDRRLDHLPPAAAGWRALFARPKAVAVGMRHRAGRARLALSRR